MIERWGVAGILGDTLTDRNEDLNGDLNDQGIDYSNHKNKNMENKKEYPYLKLYWLHVCQY